MRIAPEKSGAIFVKKKINLAIDCDDSWSE